MPATPGGPIKLYTGMRTKDCRLLMECKCLSVINIAMQRTKDGKLDVVWEKPFAGSTVMATADSEIMASKDGFASANDMLEWFEKTHGLPFVGWLITWNPKTSVDE
jgi:hypothetical protein